MKIKWKISQKIWPKPAAFCANCPVRGDCKTSYDTQECQETKQRIAENDVAQNNQDAANCRRLGLI